MKGSNTIQLEQLYQFEYPIISDENITQSELEEIPKFNPNNTSEYCILTEEAKHLLDLFNKGIFIIEDYTIKSDDNLNESLDAYENFVQLLIFNMMYGYEHEEFRNAKIKFKLRNNMGVHTLPFKGFILNTILWLPQFIIDIEDITDDHIVQENQLPEFTMKFVKDYIDKFYSVKYRKKVKFQYMNSIFDRTIYLLSLISHYFLPFMGLTINAEIYHELSDLNEDIRKSLHMTLDESKQPSENEKILADMAAKQRNLILNMPDYNIFKSLLNSNGVNKKQQAELSSMIGYKPDIDGRTIPKPITTNFLTGGIMNVTDYYIDSILGRKSHIINHELMGRGGYLLILACLSCLKDTLSKTVLDCNTSTLVHITIESKEMLKRLVGRRYRLPNDENFYTIQETDTHLIGKKIGMRSPETCNAPDGICAECYGELYYTNIDLELAGAHSATISFNPVIQGLLSIKHHQTTDSTEIVFENPKFDDYFSIISTDIVINYLSEDKINDKYLVVKVSDISGADDETTIHHNKRKKKKVDNSKEDADFDESFDFDVGEYSSDVDVMDIFNDTLSHYVKKFYVSKVKPTDENWLEAPGTEEFIEKSEKELYIHSDLLDRMSKVDNNTGSYLYINLSKIDESEYVFMIDVDNNEVSLTLKKIENLINSSDHDSCTTIDQITQRLLELIIDANLDVMSVHYEVLLRQLIRQKDNPTERPDFSSIVSDDEYTIFTIRLALKHDPSITVSLVSPYLREQLVKRTTTYSKRATSALDPLFKITLTEDD